MRLNISRDEIEQLCRIAAELGIGGEIAEVGVYLGRDGMIIARAEMAVGAITAILAAHDHRYFRMRLPVDEAVDHLNARPLEFRSPVQVLLFVEPCLEFDHGGNGFACFGGGNQRGDYR